MNGKRKENIMNERITLVSLFNQNDLDKINNLIKIIDEPLCKVPFGKNVVNREEVDTYSSISFYSFCLEY